MFFEGIAVGVVSAFVQRAITNVAPDSFKRLAFSLFYGGPSVLIEADNAFDEAKTELLSRYHDDTAVTLFLSPEKSIEGGVLDPLFTNLFLGQRLVRRKLDDAFLTCFDGRTPSRKEEDRLVVDDIIDTTKRHLLGSGKTAPYVIYQSIQEIERVLQAVADVTTRSDIILKRYAESVSAEDPIDRFSRQYFDNLSQYIDDIFVHGLEKLTRKKDIHHHLQEAYVPLYLEQLHTPEPQPKDRRSKRLDALDVVKAARWIAMRGPAGCGKTTLMQWIISKCDPFSEADDGEESLPYFPIYLPLRRLESAGTHDFSIDHVLHDTLRTPQLKRDIPADWLKNLIKREIEVVLLVDGVDEVQEDNRTKVWRFVKDVCRQYPSIRILITSRHVSSVHLSDGSYRSDIFLSQDALLEAKRLWDRPDGFFEFTIPPLANGEIIDLIDNWYAGVDPNLVARPDQDEIALYPEKLKEKLFDRRNGEVLALARTPLLCSLICMVFFLHRGRLPENKRQLYEYSTELLVESRDEARGLKTSLALKSFNHQQRLKLLRHLALIMQEGSETLGADQNIEVARSSVVAWLADWMKKESALTESAGIYLNFLIERCSMIREPASERIDFVHRSFMEFLASDEIARVRNPRQIRDKILYDEWLNTLQFCMNTDSGGMFFGKYLFAEIVGCIAEGRKIADKRRFMLRALSLLKHVTHPEDLPGYYDEHIREALKIALPPEDESEVEDFLGVPARILADALNYDIIKHLYSTKQANVASRILCAHESVDTKKILLTGFQRLEDVATIRAINQSGKLSVLEHPALFQRLCNGSYKDPVYLTPEELKRDSLRSTIIRSVRIKFPIVGDEFVGWDQLAKCVDVHFLNMRQRDLEIILSSVKRTKFGVCKRLTITQSHQFDFSIIKDLFPEVETINIQRSSGFTLVGLAEMCGVKDLWIEHCTKALELRSTDFPPSMQDVVFYRSVNPFIFDEIQSCKVSIEKIDKDNILKVPS